EGGRVELLGHSIDPRTYDDLARRTMPADVGQRDVLVLQIGLGGTRSLEVDRVVERWREGGARVTNASVSARQQWFVPDRWEPEDSRPETTFIVSAIAAWMTT